MDTNEIVTHVVSQAAIARCLNSALKQNSTLQITPTGAESTKAFHSSILRVEEEKNQLVLHQLLPGNWQEFIQPTDSVDITCHIEQGTLTFSGSLSPLDDTEDSLYSRLSFPQQLYRKQMRSSFRVSVMKCRSQSVLHLEDETELLGSCRDLSMSGARFFIPKIDTQLTEGQEIEDCRVHIADILDLSCKAKICHVEKTSENSVLSGISFQDLEPAQLNALQSAISRLERLNIAN